MFQAIKDLLTRIANALDKIAANQAPPGGLSQADAQTVADGLNVLAQKAESLIIPPSSTAPAR